MIQMKNFMIIVKQNKKCDGDKQWKKNDKRHLPIKNLRERLYTYMKVIPMKKLKKLLTLINHRILN